MDMLINRTAVIVSQSVRASAHHVVHFNYFQFYLSTMPQEAKKCYKNLEIAKSE